MRAGAVKGVREGMYHQVSRVKIPVGDFAAALSRWKCDIFHPVDALADAFQSYGHIEIYADPLAARLLDDPFVINSFIKHQRSGRGLEANLMHTFNNFHLITLIHQEGPLALFASPMNLSKLAPHIFPPPRKIEIREVIGEETGRAPSRPSLPTLDDQELSTREGSRAQETLDRMLLSLFLEDGRLQREEVDPAMEDGDRLSISDSPSQRIEGDGEEGDD